MSTLTFLVRDRATRRQIGITLLILVVYRLGAYIPAPGVDQVALSSAITQSSLTATPSH